MNLDPTTLAVAGTVGGATLSAAGWAAREAYRRLSAAGRAETSKIVERLDAIDGRDKEIVASIHELKLLIVEMRGEQSAFAERLRKTEEALDANSSAHGTLHGRLDDHSERLTRAETKLEMQGAA